MESVNEGEKVLVPCYVVSVNNLDNTCMVQVDSEDTRARLKVKQEDIQKRAV